MKTIVWTGSSLPATPVERRARRPLGRDNNAFQKMLVNYEHIVRVADELGIEAIGTAEHHLQTEGGETIPNALILFGKLAAQTQRIMFTPLTLILPTHNPLRVAEDIALLTHLFPHRIAVGFGRGYQSRWLQAMTQTEAIAALDPFSDALNREIFDEYLTVIDKAWHEDSFTHSGKHFQVPFPAQGIPNWPLAEWTRTYGSPGEVDAEGVIRQIGVVPKPLYEPTVFVPSVSAGQTVADAGRHGRVVLTVAGNDALPGLVSRYRHAARDSGRDLAPGQGIGLVRKIFFGDTFEEAFDLAARTSGYWYQHMLGPFGINEFLREPADNPEFPLRLDDERALTKRMYDKGALLLGTEEQIHDQVAQLNTVVGGAIEWLAWEFGAQALPGDDAADVQRSQLEAYSRAVAEPFRAEP